MRLGVIFQDSFSAPLTGYTHKCWPWKFSSVAAVATTRGCFVGSWNAAKRRGQFKAACSSRLWRTNTKSCERRTMHPSLLSLKINSSHRRVYGTVSWIWQENKPTLCSTIEKAFITFLLYAKGQIFTFWLINCVAITKRCKSCN